MRRRILVAVVGAMAALANRIITRPEAPTVPDWDESLDGPERYWSSDWNLTPEEWRDYHLVACEFSEHMADLRAAEHEVDFDAWRTEYMTRGEA